MQSGLHIKLSSRLSFNERRQAIIESVKDVFANTGFDGTTSRELGKAAGIPETNIRTIAFNISPQYDQRDQNR